MHEFPDNLDNQPPDVDDYFFREIVDIETATEVRRKEILARDGYRPPAPGGLADERLGDELWRLIGALAARGFYLEDTDLLSDRTLYELLVDRILEEETLDLASASEWNCRINLAQYGVDGVDDPERLFLRYYARPGRFPWTEWIPSDPNAVGLFQDHLGSRGIVDQGAGQGGAGENSQRIDVVGFAGYWSGKLFALEKHGQFFRRRQVTGIAPLHDRPLFFAVFNDAQIAAYDLDAGALAGMQRTRDDQGCQQAR